MIGADNQRLNEAEFRHLLKKYSDDYFVIHMQDELTGFLPDEAINELQSVISKIGSRRFSYKIFADEMSKHEEFEGVLPENVLKLCLNVGILGSTENVQIIRRKSFCFRHILIPARSTKRKMTACYIVA